MPVPVLSVAQMREWERQTWAAKRTPTDVISRVGHIITAYARHLTRPGDSILILAGKGHNGDDARQVVQNLTDREATLLNVREASEGLKEFNSLLSLPQALLIEGLLGIGLKGALDADWVKLIEAINRSKIPILAVDVPAGLDADTGEPQGAAIRARQTLTLGAPKQGLLAAVASPYVGRLEVAPDIGLVPCPHRSELQWTLPEDFSGFPPIRPVDGHKGVFGHLAIMAGSLGYHGAAVLAARGALRARPGLVSVVVLEEVYGPVAGQLQSAMVQPWRSGWAPPESCTALLVGPGLAVEPPPPALKAGLVRWWKHSPLPLIVDASALDWVPPGRVRSKALRVITPHPGEAARLLGVPVRTVQANRPRALRELSRRFGNATVVLKGSQTLTGHGRGELFINCSGNPSLAQGGSGDVLAGFLAGLLAQPALQSDTDQAIRYAVWQHGATADQLQVERPNWTIEDLLEWIGSVRKGTT